MPLKVDLKFMLQVNQCLNCINDPADCGCTEDDEDENGFCKKYKHRFEKGNKSNE